MDKVNEITIFRTSEGKEGVILERRYDSKPLSVGDIIESLDGSYETDAYAKFKVIQCSQPFTRQTDGKSLQSVEVMRITPYTKEDLPKLENAASNIYYEYYRMKQRTIRVCEEYVKALLTCLDKPLEILISAPDMKNNIVAVKLNKYGEIIGVRENGKEINYTMHYRNDLIGLSAKIRDDQYKRKAS